MCFPPLRRSLRFAPALAAMAAVLLMTSGPAGADAPAVAPGHTASENDLRKELARMPELGLTPTARQALADSYTRKYRDNASVGGTGILFEPTTLLAHFPPASELPVRRAPRCQLSAKEAATLGVLSRKLHTYLDRIAPPDEDGKRKDANRLRDALRRERRGQRPEWLRAEALPALVQILMAEDLPVRLTLVELMADIDGKASTIRLAQRAVFDLAPEVRAAALRTLRDRPREDSRQIFVDALRYPWSPVAEHAAEALVALDDRGAAPLLVALLDKPDPAAPHANGKGDLTLREVVRVNHQANCLLCHVPAVGGRDKVVGSDPLVLVKGGGGWSGQSRRTDPMWIRADVQFFRQDFSVALTVGPVQELRFDFLVRTRRLKTAEVREWKKRTPPEPTAYPQREATLFALRALSGKNVGHTTAAWVRLFPHANAEAEGVRLSTALLRAAPSQRDQLLARYRDARDDHSTERLACAIPHLEGKLQMKARQALVERISRLPADQLRARLQDDDAELRRAAVLACERKADMELVPDLIEVLLDSQRAVAGDAQKTLQRLTGQDFGPRADADPHARLAATAAWRDWWRRHKGL
jgi:HEAT repeat protein